MVWQQNYDPFNNIILSCLVASRCLRAAGAGGARITLC